MAGRMRSKSEMYRDGPAGLEALCNKCDGWKLKSEHFAHTSAGHIRMPCRDCMCVAARERRLAERRTPDGNELPRRRNVVRRLGRPRSVVIPYEPAQRFSEEAFAFFTSFFGLMPIKHPPLPTRQHSIL